MAKQVLHSVRHLAAFLVQAGRTVEKMGVASSEVQANPVKYTCFSSLGFIWQAKSPPRVYFPQSIVSMIRFSRASYGAISNERTRQIVCSDLQAQYLYIDDFDLASASDSSLPTSHSVKVPISRKFCDNSSAQY